MKRKLRGRQGVYASLFGVGAPEALVIGVVALLVFGPKGLAEVARNLGKTLRAFQPTIRELQEVSREFKNTLEREIGLDEPDYQRPNSTRSNPTKPAAEDTTEYSGIDVESSDSPESTEDSRQDTSVLAAAKLRGVLDQLQKEQAEEAKRTQDTPDSLDASPVASSETTNSPSSEGNNLEEIATSASSSPSPYTEIKT